MAKKVVKDHKSFTPEKKVKEEKFSSFNRPVYSFVLLDAYGPWCWSQMDGARLVDVLVKLKSKEGLNWTELYHAGSHNVEKYKITKEAKERLEYLKLEDIDEIYSLRLDGTGRLWGLKDGDWLKFIWWDPDHQICPSIKK